MSKTLLSEGSSKRNVWSIYVHCPPVVGAMDESSAKTAYTENMPIQLTRNPQKTALGPAMESVGSEVIRTLSHENRAEHENPRMDMKAKLRFKSGRFPSRARRAAS